MTWSATDSSKPDHTGPLTFVAACRLPPFPSSIIQTEAGSQMWYRRGPHLVQLPTENAPMYPVLSLCFLEQRG